MVSIMEETDLDNQDTNVKLNINNNHSTNQVHCDQEDGTSDPETLQIESLCVKCEKNGTTRMLFHKKNDDGIIISSFTCDHCGFTNNSIDDSLTFAEKCCEITFVVQDEKDLNRIIVKSPYATMKIVELDFELPPNKSRPSVVTTLEGFISNSEIDLSNMVETYESDLAQMENDSHKSDEKENYYNYIKSFVQKLKFLILELKGLLNGNSYPFTIILDDPSGKSHIQSMIPIGDDERLSKRYYERTNEILHIMGLVDLKNDETDPNTDRIREKSETLPAVTAELPDRFKVDKNIELNETLSQEPVDFIVPCSYCQSDANCRMCEIDISGFRKCLLMCNFCEKCGIKDSEIKSVNPPGEFGRKWTLEVTDVLDLNRDVLKSSFAIVKLPELEFEYQAGGDSGVYTTVEGILTKLTDKLKVDNPFMLGDSVFNEDQRMKLTSIIKRIDQLASGNPSNFPFHFVLEDPADQSYIGKRQDAKSNEADPNMKSEEFVRSAEQDEKLSIIHPAEN